MRKLCWILLITCFPLSVNAKDNSLPVSLIVGLGSCYAPAEPFGYKLEKSDPLYDTARDDHQRYLEALEDYINCLDLERSGALTELRSSFDLFIDNFGEDAVLRYAAEKKAAEE